MKKITSLPDKQCRELTEIRRRLGVTQTALANSTSLSQASISNCLAGKPVAAETVSRLLAALAEDIDHRRVSGQFAAEEARSLVRQIEDARHATGLWTPETPVVARPGGRMPVQAINRLPRPALERDLLAVLDYHPSSMAVDGPPQVGKSTLLEVFRRAAEERGFRVLFFDCSGLVTLEEQTARLFQELASALAEEWGLAPATRPVIDGLAFSRWLIGRRRAAAHRPGMIIVDQLTDLHIETLQHFMSALRALHNERGSTNLSFAIARCPRSTKHQSWMRESKAYLHPTIEVPWLSESEVQQLARLQPDLVWPDALLAELYALLLGQPYLTHFSLLLDPKPVSIAAVQSVALACHGAFRTFYNAIEHIFDDAKLRYCATQLYTQQINNQPGHYEAGYQLLKALCLIACNGKLIDSSFYSNIFEQLAQGPIEL
ncbi:MAG: AAA family ATPase [Thermoanaerobaculia bacterium]|nr:AAA family ATPase [Thermoanaerobaculia bacterium]